MKDLTRCQATIEKRIPFHRFSAHQMAQCSRAPRAGFRTCAAHWRWETGMKPLK